MNLLPPENKEIAKRQRFRLLKPVNLDLDQALDVHPVGADYGRLDNGLFYYVCSNSKPRMRAALALAVKVGSVLEEEHERGVAHVVEHLAFSATTKYTNHDIVKFLESIGAEFGPCQNASTDSEETVYQLFVPIDKPELLSQAISVLAEFSTEVRISEDDLDKERGPLMEEYRGQKNAPGRTQHANWIFMMEGSKYAERLPMGLEKVIQNVSAETVKRFYKKWYHLSSMAVIAVGDFSDTQSVVELIKTHFGHKKSAGEPPVIPKFSFPSHEQPRFQCIVEFEASGSDVLIGYKMPYEVKNTVGEVRDLTVESMFLGALNRRFFKISCREDPPFFSCTASANTLVNPLKACILTSSSKEKGTIKALESMLIEIARVRLYGFSEHEISIIRAHIMSSVESAYLELDNVQSTSLCGYYLEHFLQDEAILGSEYKAQLHKTLLVDISASDISKYAEKLRTSCSCIINTIEPRASAVVDDLKNVVSKINALEKEKNILPWDEDQIPDEIVCTKPKPGYIVQQFEYSNIGATELFLSNGMRVTYKCTDFLVDQVMLGGFAYGGKSEIPESNFFYSCLMAESLASEIGAYGYRPSILMDMLAGKRVQVDHSIDSYSRSFVVDCSPSDLETALQLVHQMFTTNVTPRDEEVKKVFQCVEEGIHGLERDPYTLFKKRVNEINHGKSYFFRYLRISDLLKIDPLEACEYFNNCFKDPSAFTVAIVGNIDPTLALALIMQYLGGIPKPPEPVLHFNRDDVKDLPVTFPRTIIRETVYSPMVEEQCFVRLCIPTELKSEKMEEEMNFVGFLSKLLEMKIMQFLRFKHGQIYTLRISPFLGVGHDKASTIGVIRGEINIKFSCDPNTASKLVDLTLDEILRLQEEGPSDEDVSAILEIEKIAHEDGLEENYWWLERILRGYKSRVYSGDLGTSFKIQDEARTKVRKCLTPLTMQLALRRIMPFPCKKQYTVVILMPQKNPRIEFLTSFLRSAKTTYGRHAKIFAGLAGVTILVLGLRRYSKSFQKS